MPEKPAATWAGCLPQINIHRPDPIFEAAFFSAAAWMDAADE